LIIGKEKILSFLIGPPPVPPKLFQRVIPRVRPSELLVQGIGVRLIVAEKLMSAAVKLVSARFDGDVDETAHVIAKFGGGG